jgi:hypothetical protein
VTIRRPFGELDWGDKLRFSDTSVNLPSYFGSMNRTLAGGNALEALDFTRECGTEPSVLFSVLLDHSIRPVQYGLRNREVERLRRLKVNHELKLHRLLNRQISGLCTLQNPIHVCCSTSI